MPWTARPREQQCARPRACSGRGQNARETGGMGRDPETTLAGLLSVGNRAVGVAAELIRSRRPAAVTAKGDRDLVTDVDLAVERTIRDLLAEATRGIGFLGSAERRTGDTAKTP